MIFLKKHLIAAMVIVVPAITSCGMEMVLNANRQVELAMGSGQFGFMDVTPTKPTKITDFLALNENGLRAINAALDFLDLNPSQPLQVTYETKTHKNCRAVITRNPYGYSYESIELQPQ